MKRDAEDEAATNVGTFELVDGTQVFSPRASSSFEEISLSVLVISSAWSCDNSSFGCSVKS